MGLLQMLKPKSFRGRCPLDPRLGSASGPRQGPLSGPLDPTPLDAPLASLAPLSWIVMTRYTNTKFVPMGLLRQPCFALAARTQHLVSIFGTLWQPEHSNCYLYNREMSLLHCLQRFSSGSLTKQI